MAPGIDAVRNNGGSASGLGSLCQRVWSRLAGLPIADNVFLRVFLGVAGALLIYALFATAMFQFLNNTRSVDYQEQLATPLMSWIASSPNKTLPNMQDLTGRHDVFTVTPMNRIPLNGIQRERLIAGQTVMIQNHASTQALMLLASGEVLSARFIDLEAETALWGSQLINRLVRASQHFQGDIDAGIQKLGDKFGFDLELVSAETLRELPLSVLEAFNNNGWAIVPIHDHSGAGLNRRRLVVAFDESSSDSSGSPVLRQGERKVLQVSQLPVFEVWAWPVLTTLVALALICMGVTLFLLLQQIEMRLRKIETAANRISRGDLDARVADPHLDAVGRLGSVFNSMADHIQRLVNVQREMIHAVSHELRTPVARIRFGIQMIEDFVDDEKVGKQLKGIDSDIQELNELIDEILTYARLEQGGPVLDFQTTNVRDVVDQIVSEQSRIHGKIKISASVQSAGNKAEVSEVEPRYIHRSLQNLVGNAARYARSSVKINANFGEETIRIDVEDDGPGVPEDDWERIFTPFARLDDSRTRSSGGYGLGLSIVRRILYWHGGQAFVSRSTMGGAKFSLVWPRRQARP